MSADTKALENLIRTLLAERDSAANADLKKLIVEAIIESSAVFNFTQELNKIQASIYDLQVAFNTAQKAPKAPASKQGAAAPKAAATATATPTASVAKLNIMQYGKQELATNNDMLHEYEAKITEKDPKEVDRIKNLETVTSRKNDIEKRKAYAGEIYKAIKDNYPDIMKDLRTRHENWKNEQQKDEHPEKLETNDETPTASQ